MESHAHIRIVLFSLLIRSNAVYVPKVPMRNEIIPISIILSPDSIIASGILGSFMPVDYYYTKS